MLAFGSGSDIKRRHMHSQKLYSFIEKQERERERETERGRDKERQRERKIKRDRETERQRERDKERERHTERDRCKTNFTASKISSLGIAFLGFSSDIEISHI